MTSTSSIKENQLDNDSSDVENTKTKINDVPCEAPEKMTKSGIITSDTKNSTLLNHNIDSRTSTELKNDKDNITIHSDNVISDTIHSLIEMVDQNVNTKSLDLLIESGAVDKNDQNKIDTKNENELNNDQVHKPTKDKCASISSNHCEKVDTSIDVENKIDLVRPSELTKQNEEPSEDDDEDIEIIEEIIKVDSSKTNHCDSSTLNNARSAPIVKDKGEPLNISVTHCAKGESENQLKILLEQKLPNSDLSSKEISLDLNKKSSSGEIENKFSFTKLTNEETGFPNFFEGLVTIGKYQPVMGDFTLKSNEALIDCPSIVTPFLVKEPDNFPPSQTQNGNLNQIFFNTSVGNFLIGIGFSRVREWFHRDMAKIKAKRIKSSGKTDELAQELKNHQTHYLQSKKANEHFISSYKTCNKCDYTTESSIVLEGHMLTPHVSSRREFQCNYCPYLHREPQSILGHMKVEHGKVGYIDSISTGYECPFCIFESNSRVKLNTHIHRCMKYFNHSRNQAPIKDFEFPCLTPKPITVSIVKTYEKSISGVSSQMPKKIAPNYYRPQAQSFDNQLNQPYFKPVINMPLSDGLHNQMFQNTTNSFNSGILPSMNSTSMLSNTLSPQQFPYVTQNFKAKKSLVPLNNNNSLHYEMQQYNKIPSQFPTNMSPPPRLQGPFPTPGHKDTASSNAPLPSHSLVVCEICDGYIKDLEQLRMHMQLIHKVKIHPKMLSSRPPLNCQKCLWRFFTDHGLERHLLGSHGLVTSNMQELANKNKDTGCCTICGRVYASKLVAHMNQIHKITLKPAHLSYKCTVCSATFGLYRLFESHVYLVHAGGTKRASSENSPVPRKAMKLNGSEY